MAVIGRAVQGSGFVCPIRKGLGVLCPGCGGTHAMLALLHGRFAQAWQSNALLLLLLPVAVLYAGSTLHGVWRRRADPFPDVPLPAVYLLLAVLAAFTVARNLPR